MSDGDEGEGASTLEQLKAQRKVKRGKMTRTLNILKTQCEKENHEIDVEVIAKLLERAEVISNTLEENHQQYGLLEKDDNEFEIAERYMEETEEKYFEVCGKAKKMMNSVKSGKSRNVNNQQKIDTN